LANFRNIQTSHIYYLLELQPHLVLRIGRISPPRFLTEWPRRLYQGSLLCCVYSVVFFYWVALSCAFCLCQYMCHSSDWLCRPPPKYNLLYTVVGGC